MSLMHQIEGICKKPQDLDSAEGASIRHFPDTLVASPILQWGMSKLLPVHPGQQVALVDDADYARVSLYRWCLSSQGYAVARIAGRMHYLQRFLLAPASRAKII